MKLFIVAALVSVAAAARLEHLERGYLPPNHNHGQAGFGSQGFASQGSFGSGSSNGFDSNVIDSAGAGTNSQGFGSAFPGATSNQYLPPNHGSSGTNGQFSGSLSGFQRSQSFGGSQNTPSQGNQYGSASNGFSRYQQQQLPKSGSQFSNGGSQFSNGGSQFSNGGSQFPNGGSQFPATSRQYLAPHSSQNIPQQAFDEQTGYHY